ncbi:Y9I2 [Hepatospora eriocheir]|uniref:Y9I2 n=1 Tax=Hepatospora eriocheir TaxID=1081669 RepID=A0A1X0Q976_9MICR|nr:Y9I2 [Hepatospora eriocheir]
MNFEEVIGVIMKESQCSREVAIDCYLESKNNITNAVDLAKEHVRSRLTTILLYKNGLVVKKGDCENFYDYDDKKNKELRDMIERGEFDKDLIDCSCDSIDVVIENFEDEEYFLLKKRKLCSIRDIYKIKHEKYPEIPVELPKEIIFDEKGDVNFVVVYNRTKSIICRIDFNSKIEKVLKHFKSIINKPVNLYINNKKYSGNQDVSDLDCSMVTLVLDVTD